MKRRSGYLDIVLQYYENEILEDSASSFKPQGDEKPFAEIVLLTDVAYFEWRALDGRSMEWQYDWEIQGRLPLQVELTLAIGAKGEEIRQVFWIPPKQNPEVVMRQMLQGGANTPGGVARPGGESPAVTIPAGQILAAVPAAARRTSRAATRSDAPSILADDPFRSHLPEIPRRRAHGGALADRDSRHGLHGHLARDFLRHGNRLRQGPRFPRPPGRGNGHRHRLQSRRQALRSHPPQKNGETGEGYEVKVISEGGRFNINSIILQDDKALSNPCSSIGGWNSTPPRKSPTPSPTGWMPTTTNRLNGAEKKYYEREGRINQPFNRPFYDLSEVSLVRGMDLVEAVRPDWRDWFTIWSGGPLDLNEAPAELIAAAAEISVEQADIFPETVRGTDGQRDTIDDVPFQNAAAALDLLGIDAEGRPDIVKRFTVNDATTRIESIGHAEGAKRKITAIVRNRTGKPALLERTEEIIP